MHRISTIAANDTSLTFREDMIRELCRTTPDEARQLAALLPMHARVRLALFCNARTHLRDRGLAIAKDCTPEAFHQEAGFAGTMFHAQAIGTVDQPAFSPSTGSKRGH